MDASQQPDPRPPPSPNLAFPPDRTPPPPNLAHPPNPPGSQPAIVLSFTALYQQAHIDEMQVQAQNQPVEDRPGSSSQQGNSARRLQPPPVPQLAINLQAMSIAAAGENSQILGNNYVLYLKIASSGGPVRVPQLFAIQQAMRRAWRANYEDITQVNQEVFKAVFSSHRAMMWVFKKQPWVVQSEVLLLEIADSKDEGFDKEQQIPMQRLGRPRQSIITDRLASGTEAGEVPFYRYSQWIINADKLPQEMNISVKQSSQQQQQDQCVRLTEEATLTKMEIMEEQRFRPSSIDHSSAPMVDRLQQHEDTVHKQQLFQRGKLTTTAESPRQARPSQHVHDVAAPPSSTALHPHCAPDESLLQLVNRSDSAGFPRNSDLLQKETPARDFVLDWQEGDSTGDVGSQQARAPALRAPRSP